MRSTKNLHNRITNKLSDALYNKKIHKKKKYCKITDCYVIC